MEFFKKNLLFQAIELISLKLHGALFNSKLEK